MCVTCKDTGIKAEVVSEPLKTVAHCDCDKGNAGWLRDCIQSCF